MQVAIKNKNKKNQFLGMFSILSRLHDQIKPFQDYWHCLLLMTLIMKETLQAYQQQL